jgi:hypothetical protein
VPPVTGLWISGSSRQKCAASIAGHYAFIAAASSVPDRRIGPADLLLNAQAYLLHFSILMEDVQTFTRFCVQAGRFIAVLDSFLPKKDGIASFYLDMARPKGFPNAPVMDLAPTPDSVFNALFRFYSGPEYFSESL